MGQINCWEIGSKTSPKFIRGQRIGNTYRTHRITTSLADILALVHWHGAAMFPIGTNSSIDKYEELRLKNR